MIYLASPYSHPDPAVRERRFQAACLAAAQLMRASHTVFAPIVHSHPLVDYGLPTDWSYWERQDREHLARCDEVVVLLLDGWRESRGVQAEVRLAENLGKPVRYLVPDALPDAGGDGSPTLARVAKGAGAGPVDRPAEEDATRAKRRGRGRKPDGAATRPARRNSSHRC
ncbi:MAG: DUF1937 family protein [Planctomycetaceae bacterium]